MRICDHHPWERKPSRRRDRIQPYGRWPRRPPFSKYGITIRATDPVAGSFPSKSVCIRRGMSGPMPVGGDCFSLNSGGLTFRVGEGTRPAGPMGHVRRDIAETAVFQRLRVILVWREFLPQPRNRPLRGWGRRIFRTQSDETGCPQSREEGTADRWGMRAEPVRLEPISQCRGTG